MGEAKCQDDEELYPWAEVDAYCMKEGKEEPEEPLGADCVFRGDFRKNFMHPPLKCFDKCSTKKLGYKAKILCENIDSGEKINASICRRNFKVLVKGDELLIWEKPPCRCPSDHDFVAEPIP